MFAQFSMGCKNSGGADENADFVAYFEQVALPPRLGKQYQAVKCHTKYPLHRTEIRLSWECQAPRTFTKELKRQIGNAGRHQNQHRSRRRAANRASRTPGVQPSPVTPVMRGACAGWGKGLPCHRFPSGRTCGNRSARRSRWPGHSARSHLPAWRQTRLWRS